MSDDETPEPPKKKMTKKASENTVSPSEDARGVATAPDAALRKIAIEEIEKWWKAQPPFWDFRKRLAAGCGVAAVVFLAGLDFALENHDLMIGGMHWITGTEARIDARVAETFDEWGNGAISKPSSNIQDAFRRKLDDWAGGNSFSEKSRDVLEGMADADVPELTKLVKRALDSQPILMFHAQARIGSASPVQVQSTGCEALVSYWFESRPENLPPDKRKLGVLSKACEVKGQMSRDPSLGIPFWARFHPDETGFKDEVYVLIQVLRELHVDDPDVELRHPFETSIKGLRIEYRPAFSELLPAGVDTVDLTSRLVSRGEGIYFGRIDTTVAAETTKPVRYQYLDLIHSLMVSLPVLPKDANPKYCNDASNMPTSPNPDPACLDEVILVVAMVMVNKGR